DVLAGREYGVDGVVMVRHEDAEPRVHGVCRQPQHTPSSGDVYVLHRWQMLDVLEQIAEQCPYACVRRGRRLFQLLLLRRRLRWICRAFRIGRVADLGERWPGRDRPSTVDIDRRLSGKCHDKNWSDE